MSDDSRDWLDIEPHEWAYHREQHECAYPNTRVLIERFASATGLDASDEFTLLDIGCGGGGNLRHFAQRFPSASMTGIDLSAELIEYAREQLDGLPLVSVAQGDIRDLDSPPFDVTLSLQLLSWLPAEESAAVFVRQLDLTGQWAVVTSLVTKADADYEVSVHDHVSGKRTCHNVLSLPRLERLACSAGFDLVLSREFEIDVDVEASDSPRSFRTIRTQDGRRLQFAGELYMPWRHLIFRRTR